MARLISCPACGKIHPAGECTIKHKRYDRYTDTPEHSFRSTHKWTLKSRHIRDRDKYLCQACLHDLDGRGVRYTMDTLEVHHIIPISEDYDSRLSDYNLITLCREHHEMAEQGKIDRDALLSIAKDNTDG